VTLAACGADTQETSDGSDSDTDSSAVQSTATEEEAGSGDEADHDTDDADHDTAESTEHGEQLVANDSDTAAAETDDGDAPVIEIEMLEFTYEPSSIEVAAGETAVLRFINHGEVEHEAMIGDAHMQEEFAASDDHGDHGDGHHGDTMAVTVAPGESVDLTVEIDEPGTVYIGCHLPGHYDAGMQAALTATT
jgi:uncharacterized cupredoxin-like copper-binding protein